jgi:hypothetical protein
MAVDSKQQKLNIGQIIPIWLKENPQGAPDAQVMTMILTKLNQAGVTTKQIGNTVFEVIKGEGPNAYFKAFNVDTAENFLENSRKFVVYARRMMNLKNMVTVFSDPAILHIFKIISMNPPMPGMGFRASKQSDGQLQVQLNLGE